MAKKVIQMYDKYQSTTKVYPKVIKESFQEDAQEYIEGQVVANPTPAGGETTLAYIEIGGTKYAIPVPTTVIANPTLAGTEAELGSIQIGETKYKIGGGKQLYQHNISMIDNTYKSFISFSIINDSNSSFSKSDVITYIKNNFSALLPLPCNAVLYYLDILHIGTSLYINYTGGSNNFHFYGVGTDGVVLTGDVTDDTTFIVYDKVIAL